MTIEDMCNINAFMSNIMINWLGVVINTILKNLLILLKSSSIFCFYIYGFLLLKNLSTEKPLELCFLPTIENFAFHQMGLVQRGRC